MPILERFSGLSIKKSRERAREEIEKQIKAAKEKAEKDDKEMALISMAVATDFVAAARLYLLISDRERDQYKKQLNEISKKVQGKEQADEITKKERLEKDRKQRELYRSMEAWKKVVDKERERRGKAEPEDVRKMEDPNRQDGKSEANEDELEHNHSGA